MKNIIRQMIGFTFGISYVVMVWYLSIFMEREKAFQIIGHHITRLAKGSLKYWVPYIRVFVVLCPLSVAKQ